MLHDIWIRSLLIFEWIVACGLSLILVALFLISMLTCIGALWGLFEAGYNALQARKKGGGL